MRRDRINARIAPEGSLEVLSQLEVGSLRDHTQGGVYEMFRRCALAVLNCGSDVDNVKLVLDHFRDFDIGIIQQERGVKLEVLNAPASAFVDGRMIKGIKEHLFAVLRDIVYVSHEIRNNPKFDLQASDGITNAVFHILRNARALKTQTYSDLVVCWGGHSIERAEYDYTKEAGYELGLRGLNICTGCGPGAMKGPMKGATIGHAKQRISGGRYVGITEPGIIAAESPNPIVNALVIMPDIEKRLEAFVRLGHGIMIFPGGVGTAEEILFLLSIMLHPDNRDMPFPVIFTGPGTNEPYFRQINEFIGETLGLDAQQRYKIIIDDPVRAAREAKKGTEEVRRYRREKSDAYYYNWLLKIDRDLQMPFVPTHANMRSLGLFRNQERFRLASNLRKAFSGIVAGNVKVEGIRAIEQHGPFEINGEPEILRPLDRLLASFVEEGRMILSGSHYQPCYRLIV